MSTVETVATAPTVGLRRLGTVVATPIDYEARGDSTEARRAERVKAVREGYDEGYADGLNRARADVERATAEARARVDSLVAALERAVRATQEADRRERDEVGQRIVATTCELLEAMLARETSLMENPGREAIVRALALGDGVETVTARLSSDDVETLSQLDGLPPGRDITIVVDGAVAPGGAIVEVGQSTIDAQLSTALERVRRALLGEGEG